MSTTRKTKHFGTRTETARMTCVAANGTGATNARTERTTKEREMAGMPEL